LDLEAKSAYIGACIEDTMGPLGNPRKYTADGLLLRCNGRLRFKLGIKRELTIPFDSMTGVDIADKSIHRRPLGIMVLDVD